MVERANITRGLDLRVADEKVVARPVHLSMQRLPAAASSPHSDALRAQAKARAACRRRRRTQGVFCTSFRDLAEFAGVVIHVGGKEIGHDQRRALVLEPLLCHADALSPRDARDAVSSSKEMMLEDISHRRRPVGRIALLDARVERAARRARASNLFVSFKSTALICDARFVTRFQYSPASTTL